jgi:hypothetical protein
MTRMQWQVLWVIAGLGVLAFALLPGPLALIFIAVTIGASAVGFVR